MKRVFDIVIASAAIILCLPVLIACALAIKAYDGGPILYTSTRVGKQGRRFQMYKLRTMRVNADAIREQLVGAETIRFKMKRDPRITFPGRFLRKSSIDELPQLLNVLKGDMSIVGPRPPIPEEVAKYNTHQFKRLAVQQGITCYWQVMGRNNLSFEEQVNLDIKYIHEQSWLTDFIILLKTVPAVLAARGAY